MERVVVSDTKGRFIIAGEFENHDEAKKKEAELKGAGLNASIIIT